MVIKKKEQSTLNKDMYAFVKKHNIKAIAILIDGKKMDVATHWSYSFNEILGLNNYLMNVIRLKNMDDQNKMIARSTEMQMSKEKQKPQMYMG